MNIDWAALFTPSTSLFELVIRGTCMYFLLLAALRVLVRRHIGSMSLMDLLLMVLIADAAQNAMANEYRSITEGIVLCGTLIAWNYFFDWLSFRYPFFEKLLEPSPLPVIKNGRFLRKNMRAEYLTPEELMSQLRQQEVQDVTEVRMAYVEPDGAVSVERYGKKEYPAHRKRKASGLR